MRVPGSWQRVATSLLAVLAILAQGQAAAALPIERPSPLETGRRVVLSEVPSDIVPESSNLWKCSCDSDGCWPGCFTVASAVVLKYWAAKGYSNIWDADDLGGLYKLREVLPNMLCYGNGNANGRPGDTGYDANDVAGGLRDWAQQRGYAFRTTAILEPTFEEIVREIESGRPVIGAFGESPWGSHAGTIVGYDSTGGQRKFIVQPNFANAANVALTWNGPNFRAFSIVTVEPASPREALRDVRPLNFDLVVTGHDAAYSRKGGWQDTPGFGHSGEAATVWTPDTATGDGGDEDPAWARWAPEVPYDGLWEVFAWMPADEIDSNLTRRATYRVTHAEGMSLARRSQQDAVQGWMSLGSYPFRKGQKAEIYLGNRTGDEVPAKLWSDAVKFAWRAPLVVRAETDPRQTFLILDGKRHRIPEADTFNALHLNPNQVRKLPPMALDQYAAGDPLPSIYTGWVGQYFNNTSLSTPTSVVRTDARIDFLWTARAPAPNMSELGYSVRWSRLLALTDGTYTFGIDAIGGLRLWVDGRLAIDAWDSPDNLLVKHAGSATLRTGLHRVDVEYVNRKGLSQIRLGNLPPSVPLPDDRSTAHATSAQVIDLHWIDTGDADGGSDARKFYVSVWRVGDAWAINSDWITGTAWNVPIPAEGRYLWRVAASDGQATSDYSAPRELLVDRTPPWAQMVAALPRNSAAYDPLSGKVVSPALANRAGIALTWETSDNLSGAGSFDVQARQIVRASWQVEPAVAYRETAQLKYELTLSGTREITRAVFVTQSVPYTTSQMVRAFTPISGTWRTVAANVPFTHTVFLGVPGNAYEFRVRARDAAGNQQQWYEGYAVAARESENSRIFSLALPHVQNP